MIKKAISLFSNFKLRVHSYFQLKKTCQHGKNNVFGDIVIVNPLNVQIGDSCSFNHGVYINATNPVIIGNDVTLSAGVKIISTGIDYVSWANGKKQHNKNNGIVIGDHVWIGANAQILEGVRITGKYVVIAAGSVVNKDIVDDYSVFGGIPSKKIKSFNDNI